MIPQTVPKVSRALILFMSVLYPTLADLPIDFSYDQCTRQLKNLMAKGLTRADIL